MNRATEKVLENCLGATLRAWKSYSHAVEHGYDENGLYGHFHDELQRLRGALWVALASQQDDDDTSYAFSLAAHLPHLLIEGASTPEQIMRRVKEYATGNPRFADSGDRSGNGP